jgi:DNA-binding NtrC family response regulator
MKQIDTPKILLVDPDPQCQATFSEILESHGVELALAGTAADALCVLREREFDLVIADLQQEDLDGLELLRRALDSQENLAVIMMAAFSSVDDAVAAMQNGAADFLTKPFSNEQLCLAVDKATRTHQLLVENHDLKEALDDRLKLHNVVAAEPSMQEILKTVKAVAETRTTVLITGESGTGKTLIARAVHQHSPRRDGPFVEVNCGALPENLLESELFGHVRGAFTGAVKSRAGKFESADNGTIFLDEIGTSSPGFQIKLLRVLQDRVIERVGDSKTIPIDTRVILATNIDLEKAVADGTFREDLYYRIHVVCLEIPPLRERRDDIAILADHFRIRHAAELEKNVVGFTDEALDFLVRAPWPGNVRQLENVIERAVLFSQHSRIVPEDLPAGIKTMARQDSDAVALPPGAHLLPLKEALEGPEKLIIEKALEHQKGNRKRAAASLGINRSTLFNKMRKFDLL